MEHSEDQRSGAEPLGPAELVIFADSGHTMPVSAEDRNQPQPTALAAGGGRIVALADDRAGIEQVRALIGPRTRVFDDPGLTVLPAFIDTHNHLMLAARNKLGVPVSRAHDIAELVALVRERAEQTPPGHWVISAADWHEVHLTERRMPTAAELDQATTAHPVLVLRGGHNGVLNSAALRLAGIGPDTPDIPGGFIARDDAGRPTGWVQDTALDKVLPYVPEPEPATLAEALGRASADYAALGIGVVRDPAVTPEQWRIYQRAQAEGRLLIRSRPMIVTTQAAVRAAGSMDDYLDGLEAQGIRPGAGDAMLRLWGLKFLLDGGVEAAALSEPYAGRPDYFGELLWEPAELTAALRATYKRGWRVGTHAFGDRAIQVLLAAIHAARDTSATLTESDYPAVLRRPDNLLIVEHGGLVGRHIAEAADVGVHITVQLPLLDGLAQALTDAWGPDRPAELFPLRELLDAGVPISAGTDHPIGPLDPLRAVHRMTTRTTPLGVLGADHAISRAEALRLYTSAGAGLCGGGLSGVLAEGAPCDLVAYREDPLSCDADDLLALRPVLTVVNGEPV